VVTHAPSVEQMLDIYSTMLLSRRLDQSCGRLVASGEMVPHYHSGAGQEALMVASIHPLRKSDQIIYKHRGYGHLLARGVEVGDIVLDMFLKAGGTNNGFGGVMHVNRPELGVPGREGVFGTRFGIAIGLAMAAKRRGSDSVVLCFYASTSSKTTHCRVTSSPRASAAATSSSSSERARSSSSRACNRSA
jgi:TPP-dependent pyruvate/acetoin dehydrogenase alpha subunit